MQKLKIIKQSTKNAVFGFCRHMLTNNNIIPPEIIHIIIFYFWDDFVFDIDHHAPNVEFNETFKIVKKTQTDNRLSTCIIGQEITNQQCNEFKMYIKWKAFGVSFYMGVVKSSISKSIQNYQEGIGRGVNKYASISIQIRSSKTHHFYLCQYDKFLVPLNYRSKESFKIGDTFALRIDFITDTLTIYHNGNKADVVSLNGWKKITPALSLGYYGEQQLEIIKIEYN